MARLRFRFGIALALASVLVVGTVGTALAGPPSRATAIKFGAVTTGQYGYATTTFTNNRSTAVYFIAIDVSATGTLDSWSADTGPTCSYGVLVQPGASCNLLVGWAPLAAGRMHEKIGFMTRADMGGVDLPEVMFSVSGIGVAP